VLRRAAPRWSWWEVFGLDERPEIDFWPRRESNQAPGAQRYRDCGKVVEPHHRSSLRSEIDVLLSAARHHVLIEVKWKSKPLGSAPERLSKLPALDSKIREHFTNAAAGLLELGVDLDVILEEGAYQTLRHLLYCRELARSGEARAELVYLVHGGFIGIDPSDPAEIEAYREEVFGSLFRPPYPQIVLWESLLAAVPAEVLDEPLAGSELHRGATFRDYLAGRRLDGQPALHGLSPQITAAADDPPLLLPGVCAYYFRDGRWDKQVRDWPVMAPRAKLLEKYTYGASAIFGHYIYRYPHSEPDRITNMDMQAADRLMGANISAQNSRWGGLESTEVQDKVAAVLRRIPVRASLEDSTFDKDVCEAIEVLTACHGVQLAIATKLLCIKRPYLIPMMDRVVQDCFGSSEASEILAGFRRLLAVPGMPARLDTLADDVARITGFAPSRIRILDELIWFDWDLRPPNPSGHCYSVNFENWRYDVHHDELGLHRVART
jgi:hypothetical protein